MGRATRPKPKRLAEKLRHIRMALGLSQNGLIRHFGLSDELTQDYISAYERGVREPPLLVLLEYARAANLYVEVLIDDSLDLPTGLPSVKKSEGVKRVSVRKGRDIR
jgi:transcriptional regulator with XRE-family HTH domain